MKKILVSMVLGLLATAGLAQTQILIPLIVSNQTQTCKHPVTLTHGTLYSIQLPILKPLARTLKPGQASTFDTSVSGMGQGAVFFSYQLAPSDLMTPKISGGYTPQGGMFTFPIHNSSLKLTIHDNRFILSC